MFKKMPKALHGKISVPKQKRKICVSDHGVSVLKLDCGRSGEDAVACTTIEEPVCTVNSESVCRQVPDNQCRLVSDVECRDVQETK